MNKIKNLIQSPINLILIILFILFSQLFFGKTLYYRDISMQDFPLIEFVVKSLSNFEFPLWNPYLFCGFPQMASIQPPLFYPLIFIYYFLPFNSALGLFLILHYFIASIGIYKLGEYLKLNKTASLVSAIIFALNSYLFEYNSLQFMLIAIAWFPFVFLAIEKILDEISFKNFRNLSIFLALLASTGRLDFIYLSFLIGLFQYLFRIMTNKENFKPLSKNFVIVGVSFLFSLLLLAIQVLPSLEFIFSTKRGSGVNLETAMSFSLNPKQLIMVFFNNFLSDNYFTRGISPIASSDFSFFLYNLYLGIPAIILAFYSLFAKEDKKKLFIFIGIFFLVLAFGKYTPFFDFLYHYLPGISMLRFPIKFFIFTTFAISILAGIGLDNFLKVEQDKNRLFIISLGSIVLTGIFLSISLIYNSYFIILSNELLAKYNLTIDNLTFVQKSILPSLLVTSLFTILILLFQRKIVTNKNLSLLLVLLLSFDFLNSNMTNLWLVDNKMLYEKTNLVLDMENKLGNKDLYRFIKPLETVAPTRNPARQISMLINNISTLNANLSVNYGFMDAYGYYPGEPSKINPIFNMLNSNISDYDRSRIMKMLGIRLYIWHIANTSISPPDKNYFNFIQSYDEIIQLWEVKDFKSIIDFKNEVISLNNDEEILDAILNPQKYNLTDNKLIIRNYTETLEKTNEKTNFNFKLIEKTNNTLTLETSTNTTGFLVIANMYDKAWKVLVDDKETELLNANFYQQAIKIEKGKHLIKLKYMPFSFALGAVISLSSLLVFGFLIIWNKRKAKIQL